MNLDRFRQLLGDAGFSTDTSACVWLCKPEFLDPSDLRDEHVQLALRFLHWAATKGLLQEWASRIKPHPPRPITAAELKTCRSIIGDALQEFLREEIQL